MTLSKSVMDENVTTGILAVKVKIKRKRHTKLSALRVVGNFKHAPHHPIHTNNIIVIHH
jgi:hypothetical protein